MSEIRVARSADAHHIREIYYPFVVASATSFETIPPSAAEMRARITSALERHAWLVLEIDNEIAGYAYSKPHRPRSAYQWAIETSAYVAPQHQGRGVARALYRALLALSTRQNYRCAIAIITLPNETSQRFHAAMGFETVARFESIGFKHGQWFSTEWRMRSLGDSDEAPETPLPLHRAVTPRECLDICKDAIRDLRVPE